MKPYIVALLLMFSASFAMAAEEGGGEAEKKQPPKPSKDSPVIQVLHLPAVEQWEKWVASYKGSRLTAWGESLKSVEGQKCWGVVVGELLPKGKVHVWRRFCVPLDGTEIWVESNFTDPEADVTYTLYGKWVDKCKPTAKSDGSC